MPTATDNPALIPSARATDLPSYRILVEGEAIPQTIHMIGLSVHHAVNKISLAKVVLLDGEPAENDFPVSAGELFVPGKQLTIELGYHQDTEAVFEGILLRHRIRARKGKPGQLILDCRDAAVKMTRHPRSRLFEEVTDGDAITQIIGEYSLENDVTATTITHPALIQSETTDWDFLVGRATANSQVVITENGKVMTTEPDTSAEPALKLQFGSTLIDLDLELDSELLWEGVETKAWSPTDQAVTSAEGSEPSPRLPGDLTADDLSGVIDGGNVAWRTHAPLDPGELQTWADALLLRHRLCLARGKVRCHGYAGIQVGDTVELSGVGSRFNGVYFVAGIQHDMDVQDWTTTLQVGIDPSWFDLQRSPEKEKLITTLPRLTHGKVTEIVDPDGAQRVRVHLPLIDASEAGIWARIATLDAGDSRGFFFRPEVDDEVLVGFLDGDPRHPVVLGYLHSSAQPAPLEAEESNPQKGFISREGLEWIFDDEKKAIHASTPAGNKIILSEDEQGIELTDQNGNSIKLTPDGIELASASEVKITAATDVKCTGLNLEMAASATLTAEGSASAELSSGGTTTVKGAVVMIN